MPRLNSAPVRLDNTLLATIKGQASKSGRSLPAEIEERLRSSLERGAWGEVEPSLAPNAQALGHLIAFLSHELMVYSPPSQQTEYIRHGINRIVGRLCLPPKALPEPAHDAETFADYWWLRLRNAGEHTFEAGRAVATPPEQRALSEIWRQLAPQQARSRKDSK
jgi:hypothetical protein